MSNIEVFQTFLTDFVPERNHKCSYLGYLEFYVNLNYLTSQFAFLWIEKVQAKFSYFQSYRILLSFPKLVELALW